MKLSEAIRLGAMMKPQGFGDLLIGGGTCALGAAYDAMGMLTGEGAAAIGWEGVATAFPILGNVGPIPPCPDCNKPEYFSFGFIISHLNDIHRWTREQIADWVETIEAQHEAKPEVCHDAVAV